MTKKKVVKKVDKKLGAKAPTKKPYSLEVTVNDVVFKTDAVDLTTALTEFVASPEFPLGAKTITILKYSKGKEVRTKLWQTPLARRMLRVIGLKPDALAVLGAKLEADLK